MINRRQLFGAAAAAAMGAKAASTLAVNGGKPVREKALKASYWGPEFYDEKERAELLDVLEARSPFRWYGPGTPKKVMQFEKEFAARMNVRYALAVTSGTAALQCAMAALEVGPGDEVILPSWTWHSCFNAVVLAGALPVCAEIDDSFGLDPEDLERHITPQTKVILAVHLQGNPCNIERIMEIARKHGVRVLEDCAQSVGASVKGKPVGSMGDVGIYSLQINKTITAGEGGAMVTNDPALFERAARFHDLGGLRAPHEEAIGGKARLDWFFGANFRMNEFTGGVLLAQTRKLDKIVGAVRANAAQVYDGLKDLPGIRFRQRFDPTGEIGTGVFIDFGTKARRERFIAAMRAENVPAAGPGGSVVLPLLPHIIAKKTIHAAWPSFTSERGRAIRYGAESCPRTVDVLGRFGGVLIDPKFTPTDVADIVAAVRKVYPEVMKA
jgi:8-amino-3,8-dideoxy-alpha-D-manno-octulosonate transaminase